MKKQIIAVALSAVMAGSIVGMNVSAEETYNVGICQLVQHVALDAATQGFKDALTDELGDAVTFDEQNAQGESNTCSTIVNFRLLRLLPTRSRSSARPLPSTAWRSASTVSTAR